jgi:hypothetical protein
MPPGYTVVVHTTGLATTILAAVGVILGLLSLAWQAWSFRASGSRVEVEVRSGMKGPSGVATIPGSATALDMKQLHAQGLTQPTLAVRVRNTGRGPTSIVGLDLHFGKGAALTETVFDPPLPFRLDGESEQTWLFDAALAKGYAATLAKTLADGRWDSVRARVSIGGRNKPVESKNEATLA